MVVGELRHAEECGIVGLVRIDKHLRRSLAVLEDDGIARQRARIRKPARIQIFAEARLACTKLGDSFGHFVRRGVMSRNAVRRRTECQTPVGPIQKGVLQPVRTAVPAFVLARAATTSEPREQHVYIARGAEADKTLRVLGVSSRDFSKVGIGKLDSPLHFVVKDGKLESVTGDKSEMLDILFQNDRNRTVAELGIGTNEAAILNGIILEDEKVYGTVHIAFGTNTSFGGINKADCHMDAVILKPTLYLDSLLVIRDGEFML